MFKKLIIFIAYSWRIVFINPKIYLHQIWYSIILGKLFSKRIDIVIKIYNNSFIIPNFFDAFYTINECFDFELYKKLKWLKNVLDIGWYLGESAIYFARFNEKVDVYEADVTNYDYLKQNVNYYSNIRAYHYALIWSDGLDTMKFHKGIENDTWWCIAENGTHDVPVKYIIDILKFNNYDWLKLDVEWAEYEIINAIIKYNIFTFVKWYVEFHNVWMDYNQTVIKNFVFFLQKRWLKILYEDIYGYVLDRQDIFSKKIFVLYFELPLTYEKCSNKVV